MLKPGRQTPTYIDMVGFIMFFLFCVSFNFLLDENSFLLHQGYTLRRYQFFQICVIIIVIIFPRNIVKMNFCCSLGCYLYCQTKFPKRVIHSNHRVIIILERTCLHNRIGRNLCKFSRPECATSQRDVTRDCMLIG